MSTHGRPRRARSAPLKMREAVSAGDVDAFLGPDDNNDSDSSDGAEAPPAISEPPGFEGMSDQDLRDELVNKWGYAEILLKGPGGEGWTPRESLVGWLRKVRQKPLQQLKELTSAELQQRLDDGRKQVANDPFLSADHAGGAWAAEDPSAWQRAVGVGTSSTAPGQHTGAPGPKEEAYAEAFAEAFEVGSLSLPNGATLRASLAEALGCAVHRVGRFFGQKAWYRSASSQTFSPREVASGEAAARLATLRDAFLAEAASAPEPRRKKQCTRADGDAASPAELAARPSDASGPCLDKGDGETPSIWDKRGRPVTARAGPQVVPPDVVQAPEPKRRRVADAASGKSKPRPFKPPEILYANEVVAQFLAGVLPNCENGTSLKDVLVEKLRRTPPVLYCRYQGANLASRRFERAGVLPEEAYSTLYRLEKAFDESL